MIGINSNASKTRFILHKKKLVPLPSSLMDVLQRKEPFTQSLASIMVKEVFKSRFSHEQDMSVFDFFEHRLGHEVSKFISDPLCRGITAGDARYLSMKSLFPDIYNKTLEKGSLFKGLVFSKKTLPPPEIDIKPSFLAEQAKDNKWTAWSLREGLQSFPDKLTDYLMKNDKVTIMTGSKIKSISFRDKEASIELEGQESPVTTDNMFSTLPSHSLASCLPSYLGQDLLRIPFVDVAVAVLEFSGHKDLNAFGFLVPSFEQSNLLGITFDSCCFPQHDKGKDITRVTCMMGGEWFDQLFGSMNNDKILEEAVKSAKSILGFSKDPVRTTFRVHKKCIPQYKVGHSVILENITDAFKKIPTNIYLLGSSFHGISVNDVIFNSRKAVNDFHVKNELQ